MMLRIRWRQSWFNLPHLRTAQALHGSDERRHTPRSARGRAGETYPYREARQRGVDATVRLGLDQKSKRTHAVATTTARNACATVSPEMLDGEGDGNRIASREAHWNSAAVTNVWRGTRLMHKHPRTDDREDASVSRPGQKAVCSGVFHLAGPRDRHIRCCTRAAHGILRCQSEAGWDAHSWNAVRRDIPGTHPGHGFRNSDAAVLADGAPTTAQ